MTRVVCLALAIAAGACAACLLVAQPAVHDNGKTRSCPGIIVSSEGGDGVYADAEHGYRRACEDKQRGLSVLAGMAALVALGAGSGVRFAGREQASAAPPPRGSHHPARGAQ